MAKKRTSDWKNLENYRKGKEQLRNAVMQHPDEDPKTSIFDYVKRNIVKNFKVISYDKFKKGDK
jgi:hypothetical protein